MNFQLFKLDLEKAEEPEIKLPKSVGLLKKQEFQKNIYFFFIDYAKAFNCTDQNKLVNSSSDGNTRPPTGLLRNLYSGKRQQLEPDMEQQTDSKLGKEYVKAVYCHPAYLTSVHSASCKMPGWVKIKLESRLPEEIRIISDMQMTTKKN